MSVVVTGAGHDTYPAGPAAGSSVASGAANVFTATPIVLIASSGAVFITGIYVEKATASGATYVLIELRSGVAGATKIGRYLVSLVTGTTIALAYRPIYPPIAVANATRIAVVAADSVGTATYLVTAEYVLQSDYGDDGKTVGTVNLVNTLTTYTGNTLQTGDSFARLGVAGAGLTALGDARIANLDATVSSRTKPADTQAAVTNLTNLPAIPANWLTAAGINAAALNGKGDWLLAANYTVPPTVVAIRTEMDSNSTKLIAIKAKTDNLPTAPADETLVIAATDAIMTRLGVPAGVTISADIAEIEVETDTIAAIKTQTDKLVFTVPNKLDVNVLYVNGILINGNGQAATPWGPCVANSWGVSWVPSWGVSWGSDIPPPVIVPGAGGFAQGGGAGHHWPSTRSSAGRVKLPDDFVTLEAAVLAGIPLEEAMEVYAPLLDEASLQAIYLFLHRRQLLLKAILLAYL